MEKNRIGLMAILVLLIISCAEKKYDRLSIEKQNTLDVYLQTAMEVHEIPGLTLAIVKGDEVVYSAYFGKADIEENVLVDKETIFRVFSLTKLITSTGIFQLVEKGKIALNDKISKYFDNLPNTWKEIRIEHLLSHSSGLPDLRYPASLSDKEVMEKLFLDKMDFESGNQFRYNQTNYWLLARIIEKVTQLSFEEYVLQNQFAESKEGVLFSSNSKEKIQNRALRYYYNQEKGVFQRDTTNNGKRGHSGNGLNISLNQFIAWDKRMNNNELLKEKTKIQMWTPFKFANREDGFLHGWGIYEVDDKTSYGFTGGNLAGFRKFVDDDLTIILLSNGYVHPGYDIIINDISKIMFTDDGGPRPVFEQDVMKHMLADDYKNAESTFMTLKKLNPKYRFDNLKWNINGIGNSFLRSGKIAEACSVYRLNTEVNHDWWVAQASYAEGLEKKGDWSKAIDFYQRAIGLNVHNDYDYNTFMLKRIEKLKNRL